MIRWCNVLLFSFCLGVAGSASAATIAPNDPTALLELLGLSSQDKRLVSAPLFNFSPFSATKETLVPGLADPLGTGVDPQLRVFGGTVQFMDLLGNFSNVAASGDSEEIELAPGALNGINLLDNFIATYLAYRGRAFDKSIWNLETADVIERNGQPVTSETSPLSLAGFGSVTENLQPFLQVWTRCAAKEKRRHAMAESLRQSGSPCSVPAICQCYSS